MNNILKKTTLFLVLSFFVITNTSAQINSKDSIPNRVLILFSKFREEKYDSIILYYFAGATKSGLVMGKKNGIESGFAFKRDLSSKKIAIVPINKRILLQQHPVDLYFDSLAALKRQELSDNVSMAHDFTLIWISQKNNSSDTIFKKISEITYLGNTCAKSIFLKYFNIYSMTIPESVFVKRKDKFKKYIFSEK